MSLSLDLKMKNISRQTVSRWMGAAMAVMMCFVAGCQKADPVVVTNAASTDADAPQDDSAKEAPATDDSSVTDSKEAEAAKTGLLRHAVFFSFKETSSKEDMMAVSSRVFDIETKKRKETY